MLDKIFGTNSLPSFVNFLLIFGFLWFLVLSRLTHKINLTQSLLFKIASSVLIDVNKQKQPSEIYYEESCS